MPTLDLGQVVGPQGQKGDQGDVGPQGPQGVQGTAATINGKNAITIEAGDNISTEMEDSTLKISAKPYNNPNLLDNWYFLEPVNQRGKKEYTGAGYAIDRWKFVPTTDGEKLSLTKEGVSITSQSPLVYLNYAVEKYNNYKGKTLTLSVLGEFHGTSSISTFTDYDGESGPYTAVYYPFTGDGKLSLYTVTFTLPDKDIKSFFQLRFCLNENGASCLVKAAKLELGPIQTLAHKEGNAWVLNNPPPNYALELTKCQRYYRIFPSIAAIPGGAAPTASTPVKKEAFSPPMRADITADKFGQITIDGSTFYYANAEL